jgi:hypothetical protein
VELSADMGFENSQQFSKTYNAWLDIYNLYMIEKPMLPGKCSPSANALVSDPIIRYMHGCG